MNRERGGSVPSSSFRSGSAGESAGPPARKERPPLTEVAIALRERDAAVQAAHRAAEEVRKLEGQLDRLARERGASPSAGRSTGERDSGDAADLQRQIVSLRQARDAAQAQKQELATQLARREDEIAELGYVRDASTKAAEQAKREALELRRQLETMAQDRDSRAHQVNEVNELKAALDEAYAQLGGSNGGSAGDPEELAGAQRQLQNLSEERDALHEHLQELETELEKHRRDADKLRKLERPRSAVQLELDEVQLQLAAASEEREMRAVREQELLAQAEALEERLVAVQEELSASSQHRESALTSLAAAQKQIDHIVRERDSVRQAGINNTLEADGELKAVRSQLGAFEKRAVDAEKRLDTLLRERDELVPKAAQFETQRLQMIDLAAQLDAARRDQLKTTADLAEARLQVKFAFGKNAQFRPAAPPRTVEPAEPRTIEIHLDSPPAAPASSPLPEGAAWLASSEPFTEAGARGALAAMKHCFQAFTKNPGDAALLRELHAQVEAFSESARASGFVALHRLSAAFSDFIQELNKYSELLNHATFRTVNQTIEFLGVLLKQKDYAALKDPAKATVYAVDDEHDICDAIRMGLETVMLRTQCTQDPSVALSELTHGAFDLILLDVSMPQMSGFELCQHIRQLPLHARTPIVFLTGMTTIENRVQSSLSGGTDMIAKPFIVAELSVKALMLILRSSLNME